MLAQTNYGMTGPTIDIVIPAIDKDLETLPLVIDSVRKMVKHPLGTIYIVSPKSPRIQSLCKQKGCRFVYENTVLPITKKQIHYRTSRWDRSGWLFQQLLKLSGDSICSSKYYLVIDADTVLLRPHTFLSGSQTVVYYRNWSQPEYFRMHKKLLGVKHSCSRSFVSHYMLFEREKVKELKRAIEARHQIPWYAAVLKNIRRTSLYGFSEFETYGNFVFAKNPGKFIFKNTLNRSLSIPVKKLQGPQFARWAKTCRSVSLHKRRGYFLPAWKVAR